jgi:nucleotide-binding universal stress UspA family protein
MGPGEMPVLQIRRTEPESRRLETQMYTKILVATDGSELGTKALEQALALGKLTGAAISVITVTDPSLLIAPGAEMMQVNTGELLAELDKARENSARQILEAAKSVAEGQGARIEALHVKNSQTADGIIGTAERHGNDLIVMGSHGRRGLGRLLLGSQAAEVLARSKVPVLIVK